MKLVSITFSLIWYDTYTLWVLFFFPTFTMGGNSNYHFLVNGYCPCE